MLRVSIGASTTWRAAAATEARRIGVDVGRPGWRERDYYRDDYTYERRYRGRDCRTVTIRRDDGRVKQIRRSARLNSQQHEL